MNESHNLFLNSRRQRSRHPSVEEVPGQTRLAGPGEDDSIVILSDTEVSKLP